jgi:uncharacterized protein
MGALIYLDASAIVPLFVIESRSAQARARLLGAVPVASPLSLAEASSAIARRVRTGEILADDAHAKLKMLDTWAAGAILMCEVTGEDFVAAMGFIRRFDLALRTPDALHIAAAGRLSAKLATFDVKMAAAATALGLEIAP